ncbi:hypothetical protein V6W86_09425 [Acinetobacter baumannii]|uniref:Uncharacterized protein n=1 Tax=Acinetobacter baumannii NIPH 80 TaxID=1217629 RepID=N9KYT8_ACIBA|nr:hypothetical protein F913_01336 [Acinetobacter baumannii NIPH 80]
MIYKIWQYGTSLPIQRIGLIILTIGLISFFAWSIETKTVFWIDAYSGWDPYFYPDRYNSIFYRIHLLFIPLGLLMTWLFRPVTKVLKCLGNWVFKNK